MRLAWAAFLAAVVFAPSPSRAGERPVLVVLSVENDGTALTANEIDAITVALATRMTERRYTVLLPSDLRILLPPQRLEAFLECRDRTCQSAIDIDRAADYLLQTRIQRAEEHYLLSAKLYDLRTSKVVKTGQQEADASGIAVMEAMKDLADALRLLPMTPEEERQASMKDLHARILKLLDGWVTHIRVFGLRAFTLVVEGEGSCQDTVRAVRAVAANTRFGTEQLRRDVQEVRRTIKPAGGDWTPEENQKIERWLASVTEGAADTAKRLGSNLKEGNQALLGPFKKRCPAELEEIFKIIADKIAAAGSPR